MHGILELVRNFRSKDKYEGMGVWSGVFFLMRALYGDKLDIG